MGYPDGLSRSVYDAHFSDKTPIGPSPQDIRAFCAEKAAEFVTKFLADWQEYYEGFTGPEITRVDMEYNLNEACHAALESAREEWGEY